MRGVSICSGVGLLDLGLKIVLGDRLRVVRYVEREAYAAATLVKRMGEGWLDQAPIWDDLFTFTGDVVSGLVGRIDLVYGGIPCTPHSAAGQRCGADDERDLWPETARLIRELRPGGFFLENTPGITAKRDTAAVLGSSGSIEGVDELPKELSYYYERIGPELRAMGYRVTEGIFSATEIGQSHQRERLYALAVAEGQQVGAFGLSRQDADGELAAMGNAEGDLRRASRDGGRYDAVGDTEGARLEGSRGAVAPPRARPERAGAVEHPEGEQQAASRVGAPPELSRPTNAGCKFMDNADSGRHFADLGEVRAGWDGSLPASPPYPNDTDGWARVLAEVPELEPAVCKLADGSAPWLDESTHQLRGLGNAVVALTSAKAFAVLAGALT